MFSKLRLKKSDLLLIAGVLFIAFLLLLPRLGKSEGSTAVITIDNKEYMIINFKETEAEYFLDLPCEPKITLRVTKDCICVSEAGCPDQICVNAGELHGDGDRAVCLPAKTVISVRGSQKNLPDAIAY